MWFYDGGETAVSVIYTLELVLLPLDFVPTPLVPRCILQSSFDDVIKSHFRENDMETYFSA